MARLRYNNELGTLGASLTATGTTITFGAAPAFSTLTSPDYIPLVLESPTSTSPSGTFEIVYLTAYTAGQTTGTITRGQEGTVGVAHNSGVAWMCAATVADHTGASPALSPYAIPAVIPGRYYWPCQDASAPATEVVHSQSLTNSGATFGATGPNGDLAVSHASGQYLVTSTSAPFINVGASTTGGPTSDLVAFWYYLTANPASQQRQLMVGDASANGGFVMDITAAGLVWSTALGGGATPTSTTAVTLNTWTRIAFAPNAGLWFNGVKDATAYTGMGPTTAVATMPSTGRVALNATVSGGTATASTLAARISKLVFYPCANQGEAAWAATSDYLLHQRLVGA